jgi:hypothetical protein
MKSESFSSLPIARLLLTMPTKAAAKTETGSHDLRRVDAQDPVEFASTALRDHLFDRLRQRKITTDDLYQLKLRRETNPEAPDSP